MFCGCALSFGDEPNVHTCPVCLGHPGTLPTINEQAVRYALMIAAALECEVPPRNDFARKNYFYPDLPKGYQISQFDQPIAVGGTFGGRRHHPRPHGGGRRQAHPHRRVAAASTARARRSSTSTAAARRWSRSSPSPTSAAPRRPASGRSCCATTLRQLGVSDVNMEEGSLRVDGNISLRPEGTEELGVKTELKNMNSFRFLERGIEAELERQRELLEAGGQVEQETLHFHPEDGSLTPLRSKEYAHDYRYFPEPDLVPVAPTEEMLKEARDALPELPAARRERYMSEVGLSARRPRRTLAFQSAYGEFFERALAAADGTSPKAIANWVTGELVAALREAGEDDPLASKATPESVAALAGLVETKAISHGSGKQVLEKLVAEGGDPAKIVEREGLAQISDSAELEAIVDAAIEAEPEAAEQVSGERQGDRPHRRRGDEGEQGPGRRRRGQKLIHERLGA